MSKSNVVTTQNEIKVKDAEHILTEEEQKQLAQANTAVNLFRQFHVIEGGMEFLNDFVKDTSPEVLEMIKHIPGGARLNAHIKSLQSGETTGDQLKKHLLPFGVDPVKESMPEYYEKYYADDELVIAVKSSKEQIQRKGRKDQMAARNIMKMHKAGDGAPIEKKSAKVEKPDVMNFKKGDDKKVKTKVSKEHPKKEIDLENSYEKGNFIPLENRVQDEAMKSFFNLIMKVQPKPEDLGKLKENKYFQTFMPNWVREIRDCIRKFGGDQEGALLTKFGDITAFDTSYSVLVKAQKILELEEIDKFDLTAKLPKYEKYLPMFSDYGKKILEKLKERAKNG